MRDFNLDVVEATTKEVFWHKFYKKAFPLMRDTKVVKFEDDQSAQRRGIDRILYFKGYQLNVEEKFRPSGGRMDFSNPTDILLEYKNIYADGSNTSGWMAKELDCTLLAYAWEDFGGGYIIPWQALKYFVEEEGGRLGYNYRNIIAKNKGHDNRGNYETHSTAIPISEFATYVPGFRLVKLV